MNKVAIIALISSFFLLPLRAEDGTAPLPGTKKVGETAPKKSYPTADTIWFQLEQVPESMHEEVEIVGSFVKVLDDLRHLEVKSKDEADQYFEMSSIKNLERFLERAQLTERMYLDDPSEGGAVRQVDLKNIRDLIGKMGRYLVVRKDFENGSKK